ncbi:hypothetical protein Tco_0431859 [Tanacetum coccineum]
MLCYLAEMEPHYIKYIKDGPFQPKTAEGAIKPESQQTQDERRVVVQDQCLKSIIIFEGPSDTKENRIMDLKLEYQTFRAKPSESLSQTYTRYKTLLNEIANDGVNLSKHEINVGFVNSLPKKWLTFSQGLRNANHNQTFDLADIYGRFVYVDNLIQRRYSDTKKALITTPSTTPISTTFFSNHVVQDFQENFNDEDYKSFKAQSDPVLKDLQLVSEPLKGTLHKIEHRSKLFIPPQIIMSQTTNDNFSLHDEDELSLHDDASLDGSVPATNKGDAHTKPPQIITTNTLSNIKLPVLQKDDYDTWAMEMEHYLEYIDNEVWKVIQNGNSKKRVTKGKDGVYRVLPPATQEEQFVDEKERKARTLLLMAVPKDHLRRFHGMDDAKEIWAAIKTKAAQILTNVASEGFKGSQAPLGSKIYKRKPKSTITPTKVLDFEEPAERPVNTGSTPTAHVNTAQVNTAQVNTGSTPSTELNTGETKRVQRRE